MYIHMYVYMNVCICICIYVYVIRIFSVSRPVQPAGTSARRGVCSQYTHTNTHTHTHTHSQFPDRPVHPLEEAYVRAFQGTPVKKDDIQILSLTLPPPPPLRPPSPSSSSPSLPQFKYPLYEAYVFSLPPAIEVPPVRRVCYRALTKAHE